MNQEWFEMKEIRRRQLDGAVWIPLRAARTVSELGTLGHEGYRTEFYGATSMAFSLGRMSEAEKLRWSDIGLTRSQHAYVQDGRYIPADTFEHYCSEIKGLALVLSQEGNTEELQQWHLHQDLVVALRLKREANTWVAIDEGYPEVARLHVDEGDKPYLLEIRAEHLKDYLCARGMALYVSSYRQRKEIVRDPSHVDWAENHRRETHGRDRWEGRLIEIHEGGEPFGSSALILHVGRENVDAEEDVPRIGISDENIVSESRTKTHRGRKLTKILGELWRNEWVSPGTQSPRVRGDKLLPTAFFITDASGTRENRETLEYAGGWLWFRPDVIMALAHRRGGALEWYTRDTGRVRCSPDSGVVFGMNGLGLVNVYAKDIALCPDWQQSLWVGFNVSPEGGVSVELLKAQAVGSPSNTQAPEAFLSRSIDVLNGAAVKKLGIRVVRDHSELKSLLRRTHRFRSVDKSGFFSLAKDLARITADSIDGAALQQIVAAPKGQEWGSLKSLENVLAKAVGPADARSLLGPLVGIYNLRHADAHLPGTDLSEAFNLVGVNQTAPFVLQGYQLMHSCVSSLNEIAKVLQGLDAG